MSGDAPAGTIFVVDDDPDVLVSLRFMLEAEGFKVNTFASGPALLSSSLPSRNDCLVIDFKMADMNGLELIDQLRDREIATPIVLVTVYEGVAAKAATSGVRHVVLKPHLEDSLVAHIKSAMREARSA